MKRALFPLCCLFAAVLHVGPFFLLETGGTRSAGGGGAGHITLISAGAVITALVADWAQPTDVQTDIEQVPNPVAPSVLQQPLLPAQRDIPTHRSMAPAMPVPPSSVQQDPAPVQPPQPPKPQSEPKTDTRPNAPEENPTPDPKPKSVTNPAQAATAVAKEVASGQGQVSTKGAAGNSEATTGNAARITTLKNRWGAAIVSRIERQLRRVKTAQSARVRLKLRIKTTGQVVALSVVASSGNPAFDTKILAATRKTKFPAAPRAMPVGTYEFSFAPRR